MSLLIFELADKFRKIADIYGGNFDPDWPPQSFIQTLTDLVFTGNGDRATEFVSQAWPTGLAGKEEFVKSYKEALSESRYYSKAAAHIF